VESLDFGEVFGASKHTLTVMLPDNDFSVVFPLLYEGYFRDFS